MPRAQNHAGRILRPAVRRGWLEGGGGAARGQDAFVEVGWDEALDLAARELARVKASTATLDLRRLVRLGQRGPLPPSAGPAAPLPQLPRRLHASVNSYSCAAMEVILPHVIGGASSAIYSSAPHWDEIAEHTELIVAFGGLAMKNTQINSGGLARHVARERAERRARGRRRLRQRQPGARRHRRPPERPLDRAAAQHGRRADDGPRAHDDRGRDARPALPARVLRRLGRARGVPHGRPRRRAARRRLGGRDLRRRAARDRGARGRDDGAAHARDRELVAAAGRSRRAAVLDGRGPGRA